MECDQIKFLGESGEKFGLFVFKTAKGTSP